MPIPVDEAGNIVLPFDVMPGALDALDAGLDGVIVIEPDADGEYPGPFTRDTTGQVRRVRPGGERHGRATEPTAVRPSGRGGDGAECGPDQ